MENKYVAIICIVNLGFTDLVMSAAKAAGARGGTVLNARGTGNKDMEKYFGVIVTPEKEIVLIVVENEIRDKILLAVNKSAGMDTKGQGIAFALPVSDVVGIATDPVVPSPADGEKPAEEEQTKAK